MYKRLIYIISLKVNKTQMEDSSRSIPQQMCPHENSPFRVHIPLCAPFLNVHNLLRISLKSTLLPTPTRSMKNEASSSELAQRSALYERSMREIKGKKYKVLTGWFSTPSYAEMTNFRDEKVGDAQYNLSKNYLKRRYVETARREKNARQETCSVKGRSTGIKQTAKEKIGRKETSF